MYKQLTIRTISQWPFIVQFSDKLNNLSYEYDIVIFMDYLKSSYFTRAMFETFSFACGLDCYFRRQKCILGSGLIVLKSESGVRELLKDMNSHKLAEIYIVVPYQPNALLNEPHEEPIIDDPKISVDNKDKRMGKCASEGCYESIVNGREWGEMDCDIEEYLFENVDCCNSRKH